MVCEWVVLTVLRKPDGGVRGIVVGDVQEVDNG